MFINKIKDFGKNKTLTVEIRRRKSVRRRANG
jgi:hypothetical protein